MPSVISHAVVGLALGYALAPAEVPRRYWLLCAGCAMLPDADSLGYYLGVQRGGLLAHRGLTHSLPFALVLSSLAVLLAFRRRQASRRRILLALFLATASHGLLDAMTSGGSGIAFFAPFDTTRYFFPFRPILVSPLSVRAFFSQRGLLILANESRWLWLPALLLTGIVWTMRRRRRQPDVV